MTDDVMCEKEVLLALSKLKTIHKDTLYWPLAKKEELERILKNQNLRNKYHIVYIGE